MKIAPENSLSKEQKDPRYIYLRIIDLKLRPYSFKNDKVLLKFQLADKYSESSFDANNFTVPHKLERIQNQAHIFKYGAQQFINISLEEKLERERKQRKEKQEKYKGSTTSGYCRILLPPLIQYPHVCHTINAQLITVRNKTEFIAKPIADLTVEIYYRLDFNAHIDIIPVSATLSHNTAQLGQMRPILELQIQEQIWESLEAGGIHPRWSGHYHAKRNKTKERSQFMTISNVGNNIELNKLTKQQRNLYHSQNLKTHQGYFDIVRFKLRSAGVYLKVKISAFPSVGKTPEVTGEAQIRMSNYGFFKYPQPSDSISFVSKQIDLYLTQDGQQNYAGNLCLDIRFIFDKNSVIQPGPFMEVMPRPMIQLQAEESSRKKNNVLKSQV